MTATLETSQLKYAAALFRKLIEPGNDPTSADFARLSSTMFEIAIVVHGEGQDRTARRKRLNAELLSRDLRPIIDAINAADPTADLSALQPAQGWMPIDLADVIHEDIPPIEWIVKPYIARPSVSVFFGKPKSMKSLLVLDLCLHVAGNVAWLATDPRGNEGLPVTGSRVMWVDLENGSAVTKRRMKAIASALGIGQERKKMIAYSMPSPWLDLSQAENGAALINRIQELSDVGIVVVDHLGQALGDVEENSPLISQVMGNIRKISEACNVAIILIHHAKKGQGKDGGTLDDQLRGHGAILANVDSAFLVQRDPIDRAQIQIIPVAVRGPEAPNSAAQFSYEQDANLELIRARFWRMAYKSDDRRAREAILNVLKLGEKNHTALRSNVKGLEPSLSDDKIRKAIANLEGANEIKVRTGAKGAKIFRLRDAEVSDENED